MHPDRVRTLDVDECLELLATRRLGRVAVFDDDGPLVVPVNYVLDRGTVVFRTGEGTKLEAAANRERVSFEVDAIDERVGAGWSVLVRGKAEEVTDAGELARLRTLPLQPLAGGDRVRYVRLLSSGITGRWIVPPARSAQG